MTDAWVAVLDALEHDLDQLHTDAAAGTVGAAAAVDLPMDLGPLPDSLRPRAEALQDRMREVEHALVVALDRSRREVAFADRRPTATPQFLDARW